jgi:hypothetical protein
MRRVVAVVCGCMAILGCASNSAFIDTSKLPDTYQCNHMKDICKEAQEFESRYSSMSADEQKEFKNLLMVYRNQCSSAQEECLKSGK